MQIKKIYLPMFFIIICLIINQTYSKRKFSKDFRERKANITVSDNKRYSWFAPRIPNTKHWINKSKRHRRQIQSTSGEIFEIYCIKRAFTLLSAPHLKHWKVNPIIPLDKNLKISLSLVNYITENLKIANYVNDANENSENMTLIQVTNPTPFKVTEIDTLLDHAGNYNETLVEFPNHSHLDDETRMIDNFMKLMSTDEDFLIENCSHKVVHKPVWYDAKTDYASLMNVISKYTNTFQFQLKKKALKTDSILDSHDIIAIAKRLYTNFGEYVSVFADPLKVGILKEQLHLLEKYIIEHYCESKRRIPIESVSFFGWLENKNDHLQQYPIYLPNNNIFPTLMSFVSYTTFTVSIGAFFNLHQSSLLRSTNSNASYIYYLPDHPIDEFQVTIPVSKQLYDSTIHEANYTRRRRSHYSISSNFTIVEENKSKAILNSKNKTEYYDFNKSQEKLWKESTEKLATSENNLPKYLQKQHLLSSTPELITEMQTSDSNISKKYFIHNLNSSISANHKTISLPNRFKRMTNSYNKNYNTTANITIKSMRESASLNNKTVDKFVIETLTNIDQKLKELKKNLSRKKNRPKRSNKSNFRTNYRNLQPDEDSIEQLYNHTDKLTLSYQTSSTTPKENKFSPGYLKSARATGSVEFVRKPVRYSTVSYQDNHDEILSKQQMHDNTVIPSDIKDLLNKFQNFLKVLSLTRPKTMKSPVTQTTEQFPQEFDFATYSPANGTFSAYTIFEKYYKAKLSNLENDMNLNVKTTNEYNFDKLHQYESVPQSRFKKSISSTLSRLEPVEYTPENVKYWENKMVPINRHFQYKNYINSTGTYKLFNATVYTE